MACIEGKPNLNLLFQRALYFEYHQENFRQCLSNKITVFGLRVKKSLAILPVNEDFHIKWHNILKMQKNNF